MKQLVRKYRALSFEQKIVIKTIIGLCFSAVLACGKLVIGLLTDYNMVSIAIYTMAILLSKLQCILGIKTERRTFEARNRLIAIFLFVASILYIGFMSRMFFIERRLKRKGMGYVLILAFLSFVELGFAIAGLFRTKNRGHYYRNIKIINFCVALIAILTTQMSILNMQSETDIVSIYNAYSGIGVGILIALCAVYILIAPKTSTVGREHAKFVLTEGEKNRLIDMSNSAAEVMLLKSFVYGGYVYRATITSNTVEGDIVRGASLWKRMNVFFKIVCCILSEILIFVWLIGRFILFLRSIDLPGRLEKRMAENGFRKDDDADIAS